MMETLVNTVKVGRSYRQGGGDVKALISATCQIGAGDRIALVGPSGSGKSTLLHLLGGLDTPTTGEISWPALGARETLRPHKVGYVFQMQSLLPPLTVVENVELPLLMGDVPESEAHLKSLDILFRISLEEIAEKLPEELSGGQAQRVAFARALVSRPQLILADEPTGQLDHPTAQRLFDVLLEFLADSDTTLVIATHDLAVAERMNTIWRIRHGILEVQ